MVTGIAHIGLFIRDIDVSLKFYTEALGFNVADSMDMPDGTRIAMVENGGQVVELVQLAGYEDYHDGFVNHFALTVDDIDGEIARLKAIGVKFEGDVVSRDIMGGVKFIMFRGPDGEHLELDQMMK